MKSQKCLNRHLTKPLFVVLCFLLGITLGIPAWAVVPVNLSGTAPSATKLAATIISPNLTSLPIPYDASGHSLYTKSTIERVLHQLDLIPLPEPIDIIPPKLVLTGPTRMTIYVGEKYTEPGFIAIDKVDGDRTDHVQVEGVVDSSEPGQYSLSYSVRDKRGNLSEVLVRRIDVIPVPLTQTTQVNEARESTKPKPETVVTSDEEMMIPLGALEPLATSYIRPQDAIIFLIVLIALSVIYLKRTKETL